MAQYRRKDKVVEPLVGDHRVAWLEDRYLVVKLREDFDREYERVEEKGKMVLRHICAGCGRIIPPTAPMWSPNERTHFCERCWKAAEFSTKKPKPHERVAEQPKARCDKCGWIFPNGASRYCTSPHEVLCDACWRKRLVGAKKPKPLTLADLNVGDVFVFSGEGCQPGGQHQFAGWPHGHHRWLYFCAAEQELMRTSIMRVVERIAHHDPTPKQLMWLNVEPKVHKALDDSLRDKWLPALTKNGQLGGRTDCALCELFYTYNCDGCIIRAFTGQGACMDTPHPLWDGQHRLVTSSMGYRQARAFALWLAEFQPPIHPTRIEVEATPEEWPGKEK